MIPDKSVVCPVLIGRTDYLLTIERAIQQVNVFQALVLAGEAGIGKSRLVAEARVRAGQQAVLPLEGHCFELDRTLPYAPYIDLLRTAIWWRRAATTNRPSLCFASWTTGAARSLTSPCSMPTSVLASPSSGRQGPWTRLSAKQRKR